jgi:hypothetical protein
MTQESRAYLVRATDMYEAPGEGDWTVGAYASCDEALAACRALVDEHLLAGYRRAIEDGRTVAPADLLRGWEGFGDCPWVVTADPDCRFEAHEYAARRAEELCKTGG